MRAQLASALSTKVTMALVSANGTATADADYLPVSTAVKFLPGETEKEVSVTIVGDTLVENDETIAISAIREGNIAASLTLTILDDDSVSLASIADTSVVEKTGSSTTAIFRVTISPPPTTSGTLQFATEHDTAGAADFAMKSGSLSFAANQTKLEIPIEVFGDAITERDERFSVKLFDANGVSLADDRGYATIYDDDVAVARPTLTIDDVSTTESSDWTEAMFTLRLSHASTETVKVSFATADGSATSASDYEHRSTVVTFAPGETTRIIAVRIAGDALHEDVETFTVWLTNGDGVVIPDVNATCTIQDDDAKRSKQRSVRR